MSDAENAMLGAMQLQAEAAEELDAARAEQERGAPFASLGLLRDALRKEREALDLQERALEQQREAIEERRRALDREEQILDDLLSQSGGAS